MTRSTVTRRHVLLAPAAAVLAAPAFANVEPSGTTWVMPSEYAPQTVRFRDEQVVGSIIVDPDSFHLYWVTEPKRGIRYTVGVGRGDLYEAGRFFIGAKKEWPSWTPTEEMIARNPARYARFADGMPGGPNNPLGARALYLFTKARGDTFLRIHGTPEPWTIASAVSNGCVRLVNEHIAALYEQVPVGAPVVLMPRTAT